MMQTVFFVFFYEVVTQSVDSLLTESGIRRAEAVVKLGEIFTSFSWNWKKCQDVPTYGDTMSCFYEIRAHQHIIKNVGGNMELQSSKLRFLFHLMSESSITSWLFFALSLLIKLISRATVTKTGRLVDREAAGFQTQMLMSPNCLTSPPL